MAYVAIADRDHHLHDPQTFIEKYVWSQDHKVIAIQYGSVAIGVGLVALALSLLMRLQIGFPDTFSFITPYNYYQFVTMHGMIMVIYLLTALFLGVWLGALAVAGFDPLAATWRVIDRFVVPAIGDIEGGHVQIIVFSLLVDLVYAWIDPRIRLT